MHGSSQGIQKVGVYDRVMSAVEAAVAVADAYGVHCEKPVVLGEAWHVLVHLWPSPVVARVTSGAPGVDPADVERELTVAWPADRTLRTPSNASCNSCDASGTRPPSRSWVIRERWPAREGEPPG